MSRGPENNFIAAIHKLLPASVYRMKNHNVYTGGVPDCWYSGSRSDLWVEYKYLVLPKRAETIVDLTAGANPMLSALQQKWLRDRDDEGRNVMVILGTPEGGLIMSGTLWNAARTAALIRAQLESKNNIARMIESLVND